MSDKPAGYAAHAVEGMIVILRGQKVILDSDLARIYGVIMAANVLNSRQAVRMSVYVAGRPRLQVEGEGCPCLLTI